MMILLAPLLMQAICCTAFLSPSSSRGNQLHTLRMGIIDDLVTQNKGGTLSSYNALEILEQIGSGSYGVVHLTKLIPKNNDSSESLPKNCVAKRAWTLEELQDKNTNNEVSDTELRELSKRCKYYLDVEQHCLEKLGRDQDDNKDTNLRYVPKLLGEYPDNEGRGDWLVFDLVATVRSDLSQQNSISLPTLTQLAISTSE